MTATTINRTPFRHMKDISTTMRASEKLRWDTLGGDEAVLPGRRKYVKLLLKRLGYRNLDKIPATDKQTPFDLGRSLPDHERENLLAIAPGIVLRDVL